MESTNPIGNPNVTEFSVEGHYVPRGETTASVVWGMSSRSLEDALRQTVAHIRYHGMGGTLLWAECTVATSDGVTRGDVLSILAKRIMGGV
jgi:hypothetical protein